MNTSASNAQVDLQNFEDVLKWIHKLTVRNAAVMKQNVVSVRLQLAAHLRVYHQSLHQQAVSSIEQVVKRTGQSENTNQCAEGAINNTSINHKLRNLLIEAMN